MTSAIGAERITAVRDRVRQHLVGREHELNLVLAAVAAGRDIVLEGPPGTSKSTLLRAITAEWGIPLVFVEGNADLTPAKLVGHHNPARVLREDYSADNFVDGPLLEAMRSGRVPVHRGVQPGSRGHPEHAADRDGRTPDRGAASGHGGGPVHVPGHRLDEPVRQRGDHPAVHLGARPDVPAGHQLPGRRGRARHRDAARPGAGAARRPAGPAHRRRGGGDPGHPRARGHPPGQQRPRRHRPDPGGGPTAGAGRQYPGLGRPGRGGGELRRHRVRRHGRRAVRPDLPGRDGRGHPGAGPAADLGGPLHPGARLPPNPVEEQSRPTRRSAAQPPRAGRS